MTEFNVEVIQLNETQKHPNADTLSIATVFGDYPVVYKTESFKQGDRVVYVPIDSMVPLSDSRFSFLSEDVGKKTHRIKARKFRGVFSMGMLVPADDSWLVGENVQEKLAISKWEPPPVNASMGPSEQAKDPGIISVYTDLDSVRKFKSLPIEEGEEVVLTEKIHGANARYVYGCGEFWAGSHKQFKKRDPKNMWWRIAEQYGLEEKLESNPHLALYGEVYGSVQDLRYGVSQGEVRFAVFDVMHTPTQTYFDYDDIVKICKKLDVSVVPELYRGPWTSALRTYAEGKSTLADHVREGFVVRPVKERFHMRAGRVVFKFIGQGYLLRKNA